MSPTAMVESSWRVARWYEKKERKKEEGEQTKRIREEEDEKGEWRKKRNQNGEKRQWREWGIPGDLSPFSDKISKWRYQIDLFSALGTCASSVHWFLDTFLFFGFYLVLFSYLMSSLWEPNKPQNALLFFLFFSFLSFFFWLLHVLFIFFLLFFSFSFFIHFLFFLFFLDPDKNRI